ncbi:MAG: helix-turn-helix domain-containing protein [Chloroflexi bacterium]|nr:helix-turn-helix domain-containing protein [Chloroflexota bacterium]
MTYDYAGVMEVTITEAARRLGISERTVRRRLHTGDLMGSQTATPQGFVWTIELPDDMPHDQAIGHDNGNSDSGEVGVLREFVAVLNHQVDAKDQQIKELHILMQQIQVALPLPKENGRPWWRLW